jgi:MOSC domain-containing protein YiiM
MLTAMEGARILNLYVSPGHNYFGRHGKTSDDHVILSRNAITCLKGRGIKGDRFLDYRPDYKGQITFFADEVYQDLSSTLGVSGVPTSVFRRNVITRGIDLEALIGEEFTLQGVRFLGTGECKPCYWMNEAFHPDAEAALQGRGGLRAKILTSGSLRTDAWLQKRGRDAVLNSQ